MEFIDKGSDQQLINYLSKSLGEEILEKAELDKTKLHLGYDKNGHKHWMKNGEDVKKDKPSAHKQEVGTDKKESATNSPSIKEEHEIRHQKAMAEYAKLSDDEIYDVEHTWEEYAQLESLIREGKSVSKEQMNEVKMLIDGLETPRQRKVMKLLLERDGATDNKKMVELVNGIIGSNRSPLKFISDEEKAEKRKEKAKTDTTSTIDTLTSSLNGLKNTALVKEYKERATNIIDNVTNNLKEIKEMLANKETVQSKQLTSISKDLKVLEKQGKFTYNADVSKQIQDIMSSVDTLKKQIKKTK